jgi:PKD repeat protein
MKRIASSTVLCLGLAAGLARAQAPEDVVWTATVGVTVRGSGLVKPGLDGWNAGAVSTRGLAAADGYVEFVAPEVTTARGIGLARGNSGTGEDDIDFAVALEADGSFGVKELGVSRGSFGSYSPGDVFRVAVRQGIVEYSRGGAVFYTSATPPVYPLSVDAALYSAGASVAGVVLSGSLVEVANVVWTDLVGASATGSTLRKAKTTSAWDAGGASIQVIASGDGWIEFTPGETTGARMCGLSHGNSDTSSGDIDFAFSLGPGGDLSIVEAGTAVGVDDIYAAGDRLRVAVEGGIVTYRKNGASLYTSATAPTYPLLADAALLTPGATVKDAEIAGSLGGFRVEEVFWRNLVGVMATGSRLLKTGGVGWNSGASSARRIASGDAFVEFGTAETNRSKILGLGNADTNQTLAEVKFGILLNDTGGVQVYESNVLRGSFGPYTATDRYSVLVRSGVVKYLRNGAVFYTSKVAPSYPLIVDTSLYNNGATLTNVVFGGIFAPNQPPIADAGPGYTGGAGVPITLDGTASRDSDGVILAYAWDFGDGTSGSDSKPQHVYTAPGTYTASLTVTDDGGATSVPATATVTVLDAREVLWIHVVGVAPTGNDLIKTGGVGWNAGAISSKAIVSGDGFALFGTKETDRNKVIGLGNIDTNQSNTDVEWGILLSDTGTYQASESGVLRGPSGTYTPADRFMVAVQSGVVKYFKNGTLFYTSTVAPRYPLSVDTSLFNLNATVADAVLVGAIAPNQAPVANTGGNYLGGTGLEVQLNGTASSDVDGIVSGWQWDFGDGTTGTGPTPKHVYLTAGLYAITLVVTDDEGLSSAPVTATVNVMEARSVLWIHVVGASTTSSTLTKTTGVNKWGDAGAISAKPIVSGEGYLEFGTAETNKIKLVGLGRGDTDQGRTDVEFGIQFGDTGTMQVSEAGVLRGPVTAYTAADRFRVQIQAGVVKYMKNLTVFYTSTVAPVYPIGADTSLFSDGATVTNALLVGTFPPNQPPTADPGASYLGGANYPIAFNGSASSDSDGIVVSYQWSFGDGGTGSGPKPQHTYATPGIYTASLTVTDNESATSAAATATVKVLDARPVMWIRAVGATPSGSSLQKSGATAGWNAGAVSAKSVVSGDAYVEFGTGEINRAKIVGFNTVDTNQALADVKFGILLTEVGTVQVYESGVRRGLFGPYTAADRFRVVLESGKISYLKNGVVFYRSLLTPTLPLMVDTSLYHKGASLAGVILAGSVLSKAPPTALIGGPYFGWAADPVTFDASGSSDIDGQVVGYAWDYGDGSTGTGAVAPHAYAAGGSYTATLTLTDDEGVTSTATAAVVVHDAPPLEGVFWRNVTGASTSGSDLGKTSGSAAWDAGGVSKRSIASGDAYLEFTATETNTRRLCGLAAVGADETPAAIAFGLQLGEDGLVSVYEGGTKVGDAGAYQAGDRFRIAIEGGIVRYRRNGRLLRSSVVAPVYPLAADAALYSPGASITAALLANAPKQPPTVRLGSDYRGEAGRVFHFDARDSDDVDGTAVAWQWDFGDGATGQGLTADHTYAAAGTYTLKLQVTDDEGLSATATAPVTIVAPLVHVRVGWKNVSGVTADGNTLRKDSGTDGWNAGASSSRTFASGDGFVEFVAAETDARRMAGLGTTDATRHYSEIKFAFDLRADGQLAVFESGVLKTTLGGYRSGDRLRVGVEGGVLRYRRNGALVYTSAAHPTYPLLVDTSLFTASFTSVSTVTAADLAAASFTNQPPTVTVSGPASCRVPCTVAFQATAKDNDLDVLDIVWGGCAAGQRGLVAKCSLPIAGTQTVSVTATDDLGGSATATRQTQGTNSGPSSVTITASNSGKCAVPCTINLTATATDPDQDTLVVVWDGCAFGYVGSTARCVLKDQGPVTASVTASDGHGATVAASTTLTGLPPTCNPCTNTPPIAQPGGPYRGAAGDPVVFDGRASRDPDGRVVQYAWVFGDASSGSGPLLQHTYAATGSYTVTLTVTDDKGATASATATVTITAAIDSDGDGLTDAQELILGTDPHKADTNDDGISDGLAVLLGISPTNPDMDGDGLTNAVERQMGTDPFNADTDGDGVPDGIDAFPLDPTRWAIAAPDPTDHTPPTITLTKPQGAVQVP